MPLYTLLVCGTYTQVNNCREKDVQQITGQRSVAEVLSSKNRSQIADDVHNTFKDYCSSAVKKYQSDLDIFSQRIYFILYCLQSYQVFVKPIYIYRKRAFIKLLTTFG